ncbi:hypothetical protein BASA81_003862 [Batrachochytrium salamandrivorans]|nr:hypothetical protein BASA81_003862 [Batrachochytrium salamandrivorans]
MNSLNPFSRLFSWGNSLETSFTNLLVLPLPQAVDIFFKNKNFATQTQDNVINALCAAAQKAPFPHEPGREWILLLSIFMIYNHPPERVVKAIVAAMRRRGDRVFEDWDQMLKEKPNLALRMQNFARSQFSQTPPLPLVHAVLNNSPDWIEKVNSIDYLVLQPYVLALEKSGCGIRFVTKILNSNRESQVENIFQSVRRFADSELHPFVSSELEQLVDAIISNHIPRLQKDIFAWSFSKLEPLLKELETFGQILCYVDTKVAVQFDPYFEVARAVVKDYAYTRDRLVIGVVLKVKAQDPSCRNLVHSTDATWALYTTVMFTSNQPWSKEVICAVLEFATKGGLQSSLNSICSKLFYSTRGEDLVCLLAMKFPEGWRIGILVQFARNLPSHERVDWSSQGDFKSFAFNRSEKTWSMQLLLLKKLLAEERSPMHPSLCSLIEAMCSVDKNWITNLVLSANGQAFLSNRIFEPFLMDGMAHLALEAFQSFPKSDLGRLHWLPKALAMVKPDNPAWTPVRQAMRLISLNLDQYSANQVGLLDRSVFVRFDNEAGQRFDDFTRTLNMECARIRRLCELETKLKHYGLLSEITLGTINLNAQPLHQVRNIQASFLDDDDEAERIALHFLMDNHSSLFAERLTAQAKANKTASASKVIKGSLKELKELLGTEATTLEKLRPLLALRHETSKEDLEFEMKIFRAHDGGITLISTDVLRDAEAILNWQKQLPTVLAGLAKVRDSLKQLPQGFGEKIESVNKWTENISMAMPVSQAQVQWRALLVLLPGLSSQHYMLFERLNETGRLHKVILEQYREGAEFSRMVEMIRRNAGNNEDEVELMEALRSSHDALAFLQTDLHCDEWFASVTQLLLRPAIVSQLDHCIQQVDRIKGLAVRLFGGDSLSHLLAVEINGSKCLPRFANGEQLTLEEAISQAIPNSPVFVALTKCRDIHKHVLRGRDLGAGIPERFLLYRAPGYFDDQVPDEKAISEEDINDSMIVDDNDGEEEEGGDEEGGDEEGGDEEEEEEDGGDETTNSKVDPSMLPVLRKLTAEEIENADMTNERDLEALMRKCFGSDFSTSKFDAVMKQENTNVLLFTDKMAAALMEKRLYVTNEVGQRLGVTIANWEEEVQAVWRTKPGILMLSNNQLRWYLSKPKDANCKAVCKLSGVHCRPNRSGRLGDFAKLFASVDPASPTSKAQVLNLGLAASRLEVMSLALNQVLAFPDSMAVSPSNLLWCSAQTTPSLVENFVLRACRNADWNFVVVCPSRLDHTARRALVTSVTKQTTGKLAFVFDDHEVETALHRALGAEKAQVGSKPLDRLVQRHYLVTVKVIKGRVGDGKSWMVKKLCQNKRSIRIGVHETFTADECSTRVMQELNAAKNNAPVCVHLDIVGGQSIVEPTNFFTTTLGDKGGSSKVTRPLEELEKFLFNFACLGFLLNESTGECVALENRKVEVFIELPGDYDLLGMLEKHLPIANVVKCEMLDVSLPRIRYEPADADDLFAGWILTQNRDFNVGDLYNAMRSWELGLQTKAPNFPASVALSCHDCFEKAMPNWTRRRQRFVIRALCERFARLARFGCFHALKPFGKNSAGGYQNLDLATVNLSTIQVAFMIDATGSMGWYLQQAKDKAITTMQQVAIKHPRAELTFACVLYRDYNAGSQRLEIFPFGPAQGLRDWLETKEVDYGDDCEDVAGGLDAVNKLTWTAATRSLVWIGDMPGHTPRYSEPMRDSLPLGYGPGMQHTYVDPQVSVRALWEKAVRIFFFKIHYTTDHMIAVLKKDYEQPGVDLKLEQFDLNGQADLFLQKTLQSIDVSLEDVEHANKKLKAYGKLSIEGILNTFSEKAQESEILVVVSGDEVNGCSAMLVSMNGPTKSTDEQLYLDQATDAEIRNAIALGLGLSSQSSKVEESLRRLEFAMTRSVAFRTLQQVESRASHSCMIMSGGTGVGKSEGARLQTQLALEQGNFDLGFELRERLLHVFVNEPDAAFEAHVVANFARANITLAAATSWKPSFAKRVVLCSPDYQNAVFLWPLTAGGNTPFLIQKDALAKFQVSSTTGEAAAVRVAHNGVNSFVVQVRCPNPESLGFRVTYEGEEVPGSPFTIQCANAHPDGRVEEDSKVYLTNRVPTAKQACEAMNNAAMECEDEAEREEVQVKFAKYVTDLLTDWIPENALVPRIPQQKSSQSLLKELQDKIERNPSDSLPEIGSFADSLRLPNLMFKLCLHPSTEVQQIDHLLGRAVSRLARVLCWAESREYDWAKNLACTVFFDELNTSPFPGLIKQLVLDRHLNGKDLATIGYEFNRNFAGDNESSEDQFGPKDLKVEMKYFYQAEDLVFFLGAINPVLAASGEEVIYTVTKLPQALNEITKSVGDLNEDMICELAQSLLRQNVKWLGEKEVENATDLVVLSHRALTRYRHDHEEMTKVWASIRNVVRVVRLIAFFVKRPDLLFRLEQESERLASDQAARFAQSSCMDGVELRRRAVLLAVGTSYWLGLNKTRSGVDLRQVFAQTLEDSTAVREWKTSAPASLVPKAISTSVTFDCFMMRQVDCVVDRMTGLCSVEHALTQPLCEHFYAIAVCSQAKIPLMIVGPPGCSKSLAVNLVLGGFKSESRVDEMFSRGMQLNMLDEHSMQCSELSTAKEISTLFARACKQVRGDGRTHSVVFLDEASLAPRALKALHEPLDLGITACVMNSNLVLDAAKTNRCLLVRRDEFGDDTKDLLSLAKAGVGIKQSGAKFPFLEGCIDGYRGLLLQGSAVQSTFHLRHFLYFIRALRRNVGEYTQWPEDVATALARNFGGLKESLFSQHVGKPFFAAIKRKVPDFPDFPPQGWKYDMVALVESALRSEPYEHNGPFNPSLHCPRNLLLVNSGEGLHWLKSVWNHNAFPSATVSMFPGDDDAIGRDAVITKVVEAMKNGDTIFLHSGDKRVYSAFYDAFNMRFSKHQDQYFVSVAIGTIWKSVKYDPKFKCIVVVNAEMYDEMRAPQSNMLPFLSRFEAFCVSPEEVLGSRTVLGRVGLTAGDSGSWGWISSATNTLAKFIETGHGSFMGVDPNQSWNVASSLVLQRLQAIKPDEVDEARAQTIVEECIGTLIHAAKPEALALRSSGAWVPKSLLREYVESKDDHFSLMRMLRNCYSEPVALGKRLVITRSVGMFTSAEEVATASGVPLANVMCLESFETVEQFERSLNLVRNSVVVLLANLSFVGADQLQHTLRLVEARSKLKNVVCVAHRASEELALDQMSIAKFTHGWKTLFVDDPMGNGAKEASTRALLCAFRVEQEEEEGAQQERLVNQMCRLCETRFRVMAVPGKLEKGDLIDQFYTGQRTLLQVFADYPELELFVCQQAKRLIGGKYSEKQQICRATDRVSKDKLNGSDSISFESAAMRATETFSDDVILSILFEVCYQGNLRAVVENLSATGFLETALDETICIATRSIVEVRAAGGAVHALPFFSHRTFTPSFLQAVAANKTLSYLFLGDCLRLVHEVPTDTNVPLQVVINWMNLGPVTAETLLEATQARDEASHRELQELAWKSRFLALICNLKEVSKLQMGEGMRCEEFACEVVKFGLERIVSNVRQSREAINTLTAVRELLALSREEQMASLIRERCKVDRELLYALAYYAGFSTACDGTVDVVTHFKLADTPVTLEGCLKLWEGKGEAKAAVLSIFMRFSADDIRQRGALVKALELVDYSPAYVMLLHQAAQHVTANPNECFELVKSKAPGAFLVDESDDALSQSIGWLYYFNQSKEEDTCRQFMQWQSSARSPFASVKQVLLLDILAAKLNANTLAGFKEHTCDSCIEYSNRQGRQVFACMTLVSTSPLLVERFVGQLTPQTKQDLLLLNDSELKEFGLTRDVLQSQPAVVVLSQFQVAVVPELVKTLQSSLESLCLFQEHAPMVYEAYRALVVGGGENEDELVQGEAFQPNGAYETIRKALDGSPLLPEAAGMTVKQAVGEGGRGGCLVRAIVTLGKQASAAVDAAALRDWSWDQHSIASSFSTRTSAEVAKYSLTRRQVSNEAKKEFQAALAFSLGSELASEATLARLERLWLDLFASTKAEWSEEDFALTKHESKAASSHAAAKNNGGAGDQDGQDDGDDKGDGNDELHLGRFDMLDQNGKALAKAIGHPCVPGLFESTAPPLAAELKDEKQRLLVVPKGRSRVLAYDEVFDLLEQWQAQGTKFVTCWACVDVLLERNSRFSRLDVVLQSKRVPKIMFERKRLMRLGAKQPKHVIKLIQTLIQVLLREDMVIKLAADSTLPLSTFLVNFDNESSALVPEGLTGASLSEFLLLLLDVKSKLGLRLFLRKETFSSKVEDPYLLYQANEDPFLHPPGSFRVLPPVAVQEEESQAGEEDGDDDDNSGMVRRNLPQNRFGASAMNRLKSMFYRSTTAAVQEEEDGEEEDGIKLTDLVVVVPWYQERRNTQLVVVAVVIPALLLLAFRFFPLLLTGK